MLVGTIRTLENEVARSGDFSVEAAQAWAAEQRKYERAGNGPEDPEIDLAPLDFVHDLIEAEEERPASKQSSSPSQRRRFFAVASGKADLDTLLPQYFAEREPGNRFWHKPLAQQSVNDTNTAIKYFKDFMGGPIILPEISRLDVREFRNRYLTEVTSPRAPNGLSFKTIDKRTSLLSAIWKWAEERGFLEEAHPNPWLDHRRGTKRGAPKTKREMYTPEQVKKLLAPLPMGDKLGDVCRIALMTGCRANEIASLPRSSVEDDGTAFFIASGKSDNV